MNAPVLVVLTARGLGLARRLQPALAGAEVMGLRGRADAADVTFKDTAEALRGLFAEGRPIVGLCAAGILIRALAPLLADKGSEPPVLALAEDGGAVVPLLGGHRGRIDQQVKLRGLRIELDLGNRGFERTLGRF